MIRRRNVLEIMNGMPANCFAGSKLGSISSIRCQKSRTHIRWDATCEVMFRGRYERALVDLRSTIWWSQTGSNRRPHACKARALPAELWPRNQKTNAALDKMVGLGRLELPTSRLSSARSNQLSYKPLTRGACLRAPVCTRCVAQAQPLARVRPRRKRNEDGEIPPMQLNSPETAGH